MSEDIDRDLSERGRRLKQEYKRKPQDPGTETEEERWTCAASGGCYQGTIPPVEFTWSSLGIVARKIYPSSPSLILDAYLDKGSGWVYIGSNTFSSINYDTKWYNTWPSGFITNSHDLIGLKLKLVSQPQAGNPRVTYAVMEVSGWWGLQYLPVNNYIEVTKDWGTSGSSPWLDIDDGDTAHIGAYAAACTMEYFTFTTFVQP